MISSTILIVDDDADLLASLVRVLKGAGFNVLCAREGAAALAEVEKSSPDLVLCDVMMPGLNGFQTTRKLKENQATAVCPVVLMSGKTDPADVYWANEVGAVALLRKPLDNRDLIAQIERFLLATRVEE